MLSADHFSLTPNPLILHKLHLIIVRNDICKLNVKAQPAMMFDVLHANTEDTGGYEACSDQSRGFCPKAELFGSRSPKIGFFHIAIFILLICWLFFDTCQNKIWH